VPQHGQLQPSSSRSGRTARSWTSPSDRPVSRSSGRAGRHVGPPPRRSDDGVPGVAPLRVRLSGRHGATKARPFASCRGAVSGDGPVSGSGTTRRRPGPGTAPGPRPPRDARGRRARSDGRQLDDLDAVVRRPAVAPRDPATRRPGGGTSDVTCAARGSTPRGSSGQPHAVVAVDHRLGAVVVVPTTSGRCGAASRRRAPSAAPCPADAEHGQVALERPPAARPHRIAVSRMPTVRGLGSAP
jgi:hypothetical protein